MDKKKKVDAKKVGRVVNDIFKALPSDNSIINEIVKDSMSKNMILNASTRAMSYDVWRSEDDKSKYNVIRSMNPNYKTAHLKGGDFSKKMSKKEFLKEFISSVVKDFLKTDEECKSFFKDLK